MAAVARSAAVAARANRAVLSQAPGSVGGRFKLTEQGEVIFARYGSLPIARRTSSR